ncbi:MAG: chloride channel protein [Deltaproteobacteria bacterium]|nr:chloride channel protein [Deltaproteobacteria bacterium]
MIATRLARMIREFDFQVAGKWLALGLVVGVATGLAAIGFQLCVDAARSFFLAHLMGLPLTGPGGEPSEFSFGTGEYASWLVVAIPALGGLVAGALVYWLAPEAEGHGTDAAIRAYHRKLGVIRARVPPVKTLASAITLGTGGSGGREGPIALIGAGIGSFLAVRLGLSPRTRRWLLAAGIGAGVGAIFRAPLAGALFAGEVLYSSSDVETEVLLPAVVASIVAYSIYTIRYGSGHMFVGAGTSGFSNPLELGPYLVLAVVVALAALAYVNIFYGMRDLFARLPIPRAFRAMIGGAMTGGIALLLIQLAGGPVHVVDVMSSGYGVIQQIINTDGAGVTVLVLLAISLGKILTTSLTIGSGGSAGVFGPSMVIGATLGAAVGKAFHVLMPGIVAHPTTFAIVGMAGFFAAAANTPISTVVMVSELTGNYELLMPSMWVCALAFLVGRRWSIYRAQEPSKLWSPAHFGEFAPEVLATATVGEVFRRERKFVTLRADMTLDEVLDATAHTRQRLFPVLDAAGKLSGAFRIDELTHALQDRARGGVEPRARDLVPRRTLAVRLSDKVERAQKMLRNNHVQELLVLEDGDEQRVAGIVTGADILLAHTRGLSRWQVGGPEAAPRQDGTAASRTPDEGRES